VAGAPSTASRRRDGMSASRFLFRVPSSRRAAESAETVS
jgi:hypothetical protein